MKSASGLEGIDQTGMAVKILSFSILLDGGTQEWLIQVDGKQVRFDVDGALESATKGRIYAYSGTKKLLDLGGKGEYQILTILRRWLGQFWSEDQQKEMVNEETVFSEPEGVISSYPPAAKSAAELLAKLKARQKPGSAEKLD